MLKNIRDRYGFLSDSIISEISYKREINQLNSDEGTIEVIISCFNIENDYETIKLIFKGIILFKLIELSVGSNFYPKETFSSDENGIITFDFDSIDSNSGIEENSNSNFIIKCKEIYYEILRVLE